MIHTISQMFQLSDEDMHKIYRSQGQRLDRFDFLEAAVKKINSHLESTYPPLRILWVKQISDEEWLVSIKTDVLKILGRGDVHDADYIRIEDYLKQMFSDHGVNPVVYDSHTLTRIDYKLDVQIPDPVHRELLFHLLKKQAKKHRFKLKINWGKDKHGNPFEYEMSQYHTNQSTELCIYSKEDERAAKKQEPRDYERDVVRYELRLKNEHLNTQKRKKTNARVKKLSVYFQESVWREYMQKHVLPIVHKGDYYRLRDAEKVITNSPSISPLKKKKLRDFLVEISKGSLDTPLNNGMSRPTHRQYLRDLESLGVNPILIPKNRTDFPSMLKNPFSL